MNARIPALTQKQVMAHFPKRPRDSHKGLFGIVAVIGGAAGMMGAPLLAGRAALKLGAGSVHVGLLAENAPAVDPVQPELMLHSATEIVSHPFALSLMKPLAIRLSPQAGKSLVMSKGKQSVIAIGCGLGTSSAAQKLLYEAFKHNTALVLDADALNLLAKHADLQDDLRNRKAATVLTPHPGEAAHLLACSTAEIQSDRVAAVKKIAQTFRCSVVLKGADSLCMTRKGKLFVNKTGNPGMSSAGMGDVLTGMIAAFIAQGMTADDAMLLAVRLHGAAGDALAEQGITIGMTAGDVTEWARWLLNHWLAN